MGKTERIGNFSDYICLIAHEESTHMSNFTSSITGGCKDVTECGSFQ